jgi:hypothetical protein
MNPSTARTITSVRARTGLIAGLLAASVTLASEGNQASAAPASESKWGAKGKLQVGGKNANVGTDTDRNLTAGSGPGSISVPPQGTQEASGSLKLAGGKVGPVDVGIAAKAKVKTESLGRDGQNKDNIYDERNFGSVTVSGSLAGTAKVGGNGVALGGEISTPTKSQKFTIDQRSSPFWRDRAEVLDKADKQINRDQLEADAQARAAAAQAQPSDIPRSKDANEAIANYNKTQLELAKLTGKAPKLMEPLPVQPGGTPAAPAAPAERMVSGYMILPRPADYTDEDWQFFARTLGEQIAQFNLGGVVQVGARDVRIRFEQITEAAFNEQRGQIEQMGFRIQYDR